MSEPTTGPQITTEQVSPADLSHPFTPREDQAAPGGLGPAAQAASGGGPDEPSSAAEAAVTGEQAPLFLAEVALGIGVRLKASRLGVEARREDVTFNAAERSTLELLSPMAAPMVGRAAQMAPLIGAACFALTLLTCLQDRSRRLEERAPAVPKKPKPGRRPKTAPKEPAAADPQPEAREITQEEIDHQRRWKDMATVIPMGTPVVDSGKFPPRRVQTMGDGEIPMASVG